MDEGFEVLWRMKVKKVGWKNRRGEVDAKTGGSSIR